MGPHQQWGPPSHSRQTNKGPKHRASAPFFCLTPDNGGFVVFMLTILAPRIPAVVSAGRALFLYFRKLKSFSHSRTRCRAGGRMRCPATVPRSHGDFSSPLLPQADGAGPHLAMSPQLMLLAHSASAGRGSVVVCETQSTSWCAGVCACACACGRTCSDGCECGHAGMCVETQTLMGVAPTPH